MSFAPSEPYSPYSTNFKITEQQYQQFRSKIEWTFDRFDYDPENGRIMLRITSCLQQSFAGMVGDEIAYQLGSIGRALHSKSSPFARAIQKGNTRSHVLLAERDSPGGSKAALRRQPDVLFRHNQAVYPGVVVEVSRGRDGKDLEKLAQDYILYSNGDIKAVLGFSLNAVGKECSVSVWQPKFSKSEKPGVDVLEVKCEMLNCEFRAADGMVNRWGRVWLKLSDFATDELTGDCGSRMISISFYKLGQLMARAERAERDNKPSYRARSEGIKSRRRTVKRLKASRS